MLFSETEALPGPVKDGKHDFSYGCAELSHQEMSEWRYHWYSIYKKPS